MTSPLDPGPALKFILDAEPKLVGLVTLSRSRDKFYAATPWAQAVTGAHPIAVLNQAFHAKGLEAGAKLLRLYQEIRRFETVTIERRQDELVRVTVRNAETGESAWPNLRDKSSELTPELLDAEYHRVRVNVYPLAQELERTISFAARWKRSRCSGCGGLGYIGTDGARAPGDSDTRVNCGQCGEWRDGCLVNVQQHLDDYELGLLRFWTRRWVRQQRAMIGDPVGSAWETALKSLLERLAEFLRLELTEASLLVTGPRVITITVKASEVRISIGGVELNLGGLSDDGFIDISKFSSVSSGHDPNCPTCIYEADHQCKSCGALVEWPDGESSDYCQGCAAPDQNTPGTT